MSSAVNVSKHSKKAGWGGVGRFLNGIQTLEWKRLRPIHIFSKASKLLWYISCLASRTCISGFRRMSRTKKSWIPSGMSYLTVGSSPTSCSWGGVVKGTQAHRAPRLSGEALPGPSEDAAALGTGSRSSPGLQCAAAWSPATWRSSWWARTVRLCAGYNGGFATTGIRSPAVPRDAAVPRAPLLSPLAGVTALPSGDFIPGDVSSKSAWRNAWDPRKSLEMDTGCASQPPLSRTRLPTLLKCQVSVGEVGGG